MAKSTVIGNLNMTENPLDFAENLLKSIDTWWDPVQIHRRLLKASLEASISWMFFDLKSIFGDLFKAFCFENVYTKNGEHRPDFNENLWQSGDTWSEPAETH